MKKPPKVPVVWVYTNYAGELAFEPTRKLARFVNWGPGLPVKYIRAPTPKKRAKKRSKAK